MQTYQVRITCGYKHHKCFKFNSNLELVFIKDILNKVVKSNYNLRIFKINHHSNLDDKNLEYAIKEVSTTRFYENQWVETVEVKTVEYWKPMDKFIMIPYGCEIRLNTSCDMTFFSIEFPSQKYPFYVSAARLTQELGIDVNRCCSDAVHEFYMHGTYKFETVREDYGVMCCLYQHIVRNVNKVTGEIKKVEL